MTAVPARFPDWYRPEPPALPLGITARTLAMIDAMTAAICYAVTGATGSMIDLSPWADELRGTAKRPTAGPAVQRRFEAFTDCPKCGQLDVHWMRAPIPESEQRPVRSDGVINIYGPDESMYEVIRTCRRCNHDWGQI